MECQFSESHVPEIDARSCREHFEFESARHLPVNQSQRSMVSRHKATHMNKNNNQCISIVNSAGYYSTCNRWGTDFWKGIFGSWQTSSEE